MLLPSLLLSKGKFIGEKKPKSLPGSTLCQPQQVALRLRKYPGTEAQLCHLYKLCLQAIFASFYERYYLCNAIVSKMCFWLPMD